MKENELWRKTIQFIVKHVFSQVNIYLIITITLIFIIKSYFYNAT